jgi:hypothetical protein
VTDTVFAFSRGIYNTVSDGLSSVVYAGQDRKSPPSKNYKNKNNNNRKSGMFGFLFKLNPNAAQRTNQIRGRHINPWRPFWQFFNSNKKTEKKKLTWFQSLLYVETPTVGNKLLAG